MDRRLNFNNVKTITYDAASLVMPDGYELQKSVTDVTTVPLAKVCVKWKPSRYGQTSVETRWIAPSDLPEAYKELGRAIAIAGYTEPQWWQYWRWGEHRPRPEIIKAYREFLLNPPSPSQTPT